MDGDGEPTSSDAASGRRSGWRTARLVTAFVLSLGLVATVVVSSWVDRAEVCRDVLSESTDEVVQLCEPLAGTSALVLVWAFAIVLVLLPDFSEIAIPGFLSLKREVKEQARRQELLEQRIEMSQTANANASIVIADADTFAKLGAQVDEKEEAFGTAGAESQDSQLIADEPTPALPDPQEEARDDRRAVLGQELIDRWERLSRAEGEARRLQGIRDAAVVSSGGSSFQVGAETLALMRWANLFSEELRYVQAARNAAAHAQPVDRETLERASELARKLEYALPSADPKHFGYALERRMASWLLSTGVEAVDLKSQASSGRWRYDFVGRRDGHFVVAEAKLTSRPVSRSQIVSWIALLEDKAAEFPNNRGILVVSAPDISEAAREYLRARKPANIEVYLERAPGQFDLIS